jgi:hypothetical protein
MSYLEGLTNQEHSNYIDNLTINGRELDDNAKNRMIIFWNLLLRNSNNDVNEASQSLFACLAEAVDLENEISIDVLNNCIASEEPYNSILSSYSSHPVSSSPELSLSSESPSPISMHDSMSSYSSPPYRESPSPMYDSMPYHISSPELSLSSESPSPISMHDSMSTSSSFVPIYESPSPISMHSSMPSFSSFSTLSLSPSSQESPIRRRTIHLRPVVKRTNRRRPLIKKPKRENTIRRRTNRARTMHRRRRTNRKK